MVSALDQCSLKNIKKQIYRLGMVAHNPSTQDTRRRRRRRGRRRKRKRRRKGKKKERK